MFLKGSQHAAGGGFAQYQQIERDRSLQLPSELLAELHQSEQQPPPPPPPIRRKAVSLNERVPPPPALPSAPILNSPPLLYSDGLQNDFDVMGGALPTQQGDQTLQQKPQQLQQPQQPPAAVAAGSIGSEEEQEDRPEDSIGTNSLKQEPEGDLADSNVGQSSVNEEESSVNAPGNAAADAQTLAAGTEASDNAIEAKEQELEEREIEAEEREKLEMDTELQQNAESEAENAEKHTKLLPSQPSLLVRLPTPPAPPASASAQDGQDSASNGCCDDAQVRRDKKRLAVLAKLVKARQVHAAAYVNWLKLATATLGRIKEEMGQVNKSRSAVLESMAPLIQEQQEIQNQFRRDKLKQELDDAKDQLNKLDASASDLLDQKSQLSASAQEAKSKVEQLQSLLGQSAENNGASPASQTSAISPPALTESSSHYAVRKSHSKNIATRKDAWSDEEM